MPMRSATLLLKIIKNKKQTNSHRTSWKILCLIILVPTLFIYLQGTAFLNLFYNRRFWLRHYGSIMHLHKISPRSKREGEPGLGKQRDFRGFSAVTDSNQQLTNFQFFKFARNSRFAVSAFKN